MSTSLVYKLLLFFALVGFGVASYLAYVYTFGLPLPCSNSGCEVVRFSKYSRMFGISVPFYGMTFYLGMIGVSIWGLTNKPKAQQLAILGGTLGFLFSLYFTFLELFVIKAICTWCVVSAVISTILFVLSLILMKSSKIKSNES